MRRWPWAHVAITGASAGIGRALAEAVAAPGVSLLLVARREPALAGVAAGLRARGAWVETAALDVRDASALAERLLDFDARHPIDLVIANAGVSGGLAPDGRAEDAAAARRIVDVNLTGAINTVAPLLPGLRARGRGRVVLVSSLAARRPLPEMPAYAASKAGLRAYGIALRGALRPSGVGVTVACPGFVTTAMSARHLGPKPWEMPADRAACAILGAAARGRAVTSFPWPLALLGWIGAQLPPALADRAIRRFAARVRPEDGPP